MIRQHILPALALFVLLTACGAPADTETASGTAAASGSASPSIAASAAPSISPSSAASTTPSATPIVSTDLAPITSTETAMSTALMELCVLSQEGGLAGATETTTVLSDGTVTVERDRPPSTQTAQAAPDQIDALRAVVESDEWQQLDARYGRQLPDGFAYNIRCGGKSVTTYDGATNPAVLTDVLEQIGALRRQAVQP